jgi:tetratricopeptide (TPR) repeat protein
MPSKFNAPSPLGRAGLPAGFGGARLTFYDVLGIDPRADSEAVKRAFRSKIKRYHPDLRGVDAVTSHWSTVIITANEILRHPERRAAYDEYLAQLRAPLLRARRQRKMVYAACFVACFSLALVSGLKFGGTLRTMLSQRVTTFTHSRSEVEAVAGERVHRLDRGIASERLVATVGSSRGPDFAPATASIHDSENRRATPQPKPDMPPVRAESVPASLPTYRPPLPAGSVRGGEIDRIIAEADRLIQRAPDDARVFRLRGKAWARKGEFDKAIVDLDHAVRISFSDPELYADRGAAWFEKGSYDRALADFDQAIKINPSLVAAHVGRAAVFERRGDKMRARADRELVARLEHRGLGPQTDTTTPAEGDR